MARNWSVYERNQLLKYGFADYDLNRFGEMPVEYITGHADFDGLDFVVNKDVLIPRIESIQMVDEAEGLLGNRKEVTFAEIGTGCGAIGIALYIRLIKKGVKVKAILSDVSHEALVVARRNLTSLAGESPMIDLVESNLMSQIKEPEKFDVILANLPYIPSSRVPRLPASVVDYEPRIALDGGTDGLVLIKELLRQAKDRLVASGGVILEIDYSHDIPDFVEISGYRYELVQDEFGQNRFLIGRPIART